MAQSFPKRGLIWIGVGLALLIAGFFMKNPLVLRGTSLPFWPFVTGLGAAILIYDVVRSRKRGDSPTSPP